MSERAQKFVELYQAGMEQIQAGKDDEGTRLLFEAAKTSPEGWLAIATQLLKDGQTEIAEKRFCEVLSLTKNNVIRCAATNNLGMIYANRGHNEMAFALFEKAATLCPEIADSFSNKALMRMHRADWPATFRYVNQALKLDPWHEQAQFIHAMALLQSGDYEHGFKAYECRWRSKNNGLQKIHAAAPEWDGTNGKNLFVYGEQGHGDSILMLRYAAEIKRRGIRQTWVAQKALSPLVQAMPEIDAVAEVGSPIPDFDCHIPAVSLPRVLGTTIETIPPSPYLSVEEWPEICLPGLNVGIAWRGSKVQGNDLFRSTSLKLWEPVLNVPGVTFHSLQVEDDDEGLLYPQLIQSEKPKDFLESARRVKSMDLIISVDTSLVHLAGALGVPCWCALHCRPYFVYPQHHGERTPWYASVKLYRQERELEWKPVFERIAEDLKCLS